MKLLDESTEDKKFDIRILAKNVARGQVSQKELNDQNKNLPDDAEYADYVSIDELFATDDSRRR